MGARNRTQVLPQELVTSEPSVQFQNLHTSKTGADEKIRGKKGIEKRGFHVSQFSNSEVISGKAYRVVQK